MQIDREEEEQLCEMPQQELKIIHHNTTRVCFTQTSPSSPPFDFEACLPSSTDTSFELQMHQDNINSMRAATDRLLEECLAEKFNKELGFQNPNLFKMNSIGFKCENELESIVMNNDLMSQEMVKWLCCEMEKEEGLIGLLKEVPRTFGLTVGKEIVYVIYHILHAKIKAFKALLQNKESIIPKMPCFQNCDDQFNFQLTATSCPVYEEISLEEVISFAEKGNQSCINELYFGQLRLLNLKDVALDTKKTVNVHEKFGKLVTQFSKIVFLSLIGATEPPKGVPGLELSRQISLAQFSEGGLSIQRSFSRPFMPGDDEESYDFVSKKIKFE